LLSLLKVKNSIIAMANRGFAKLNNTLPYYVYRLPCYLICALRFIHHNHWLLAMCIFKVVVKSAKNNFKELLK